MKAAGSVRSAAASPADSIDDAEAAFAVGDRGLSRLAGVDGDDGRAADPAARRAGAAADDGAAEGAAAATAGCCPVSGS